MARHLISADTPEQRKLRDAVSWYKQFYADEYALFCDAMKVKRSLTRDEFATLEGSPDHRALHEMPEHLFERIILTFTPEEMAWFSTNKANRWFAKTFPEFAIAQSI